MRLHDRDTMLHLLGLHDLTATQLVAVADVLQVTVDELLTTTPTGDVVADFRSPGQDGAALHAALLRFGTLTEHQVTTAFGWSPGRLDTAVAHLHRHLDSHSSVRIRRVGRRLELDLTRDALPGYAVDTLVALQAHTAALTAELTPSLLVAVRAHGLGDPPGPPTEPWQVADTLARQHAALPPGDRTHIAQRVRLIPHPDLLFALHLVDCLLTDRPSPDPGPS